jgi:hypothetical protein
MTHLGQEKCRGYRTRFRGQLRTKDGWELHLISTSPQHVHPRDEVRPLRAAYKREKGT